MSLAEPKHESRRDTTRNRQALGVIVSIQAVTAQPRLRYSLESQDTIELWHGEDAKLRVKVYDSVIDVNGI